MRNVFIPLLCLTTLVACNSSDKDNSRNTRDYVEFMEPKHYLCPMSENIYIDGNIDDWENISWTDYFNDIEGGDKPEPRFKTRAKMAWDQEYLYIMAEMQEPDVWAKITKRDEVIFYDNDFEVFIDPDGDTHHYYELEINAFETAWDLLLTMPYRDFGYVLDHWDINGLKIAVKVDGTINDPSDTDKGWTVELALPFDVLKECSGADDLPAPGDYWRINFSRVEWKTEVKDGVYVKQMNPDTGKSYPEDNWTWSPQYHINMHMPEYWGFLVFADENGKAGEEKWQVPENEKLKWHLRNVYYMQTAYFADNKKFAESAAVLGWPSDKGITPDIEITTMGYYASVACEDGGKWIIDSKGKTSKIK